MTDKTALFQAANDVRMQAYAPYSKFLVGAAVQTADGVIHRGCNVENVAYPEGTCAEAGAIAAMCSAGGDRQIVAVLVVADSPEPVSPCGGCRQKLAEFGAPDVTIYLADLSGIRAETSLGALLPGAFTTTHLADAG